MDDHEERLEATVLGRVQGVGFRWFVLREAAALDLAGWVGNRLDGSVAVVAQGPRPALDRLERALHAGPPGAAVRDVRARRVAPAPLTPGFLIRGAGHPGD